MTDSITCPRCGMVSHNPSDIAQRYCGKCHAFHCDMVRIVSVSEHRSDVMIGERRLGYIMRMFDTGGVLVIDPESGRRVNYIVSPEQGGLARAEVHGLASAETETEAINALLALDTPT